MTTLRTERLLLRLPQLDDAEAAGALLADEQVMRFIGGVVPRDAWTAVLEKWCRRWELSGMGPFIIERRDDGSFVGRVGFIVWDVRRWTQSNRPEAGAFGQPELGWALVRAQWGNGFATEAARAARAWFREQHGADRLVSVIAPDNVSSQRLAERLGATPGETVHLYDYGNAVVWDHP